VELDVRRSADSVAVICHDPRYADGTLIVELAADRRPSAVPTLSEALDACDGMWVNIEIKNDPTEPDHDPAASMAGVVAAELAARGEPERWLISSFHRPTIEAFRVLAPEVPTAWLTLLGDDMGRTPGGNAVTVEEMLDSLASHGHVAVHPWVEVLTRDVIEAAHARGLAVNTWTCDAPERMSELIDWGVDGICTNVPDLALIARSTGG
jgi:glycerophosphoryl diester phosphodiesterase